MQEAGGNRNPWPSKDPNWAYNNAGDRANCQTAISNLVEAIRACRELGIDWTEVQECRQMLDERPSDYWGGLWQALLKYGGMTAQNFNNELVASVFVDQASPDIWKYFKEHLPGWQRETLQKIPSVATFMFDEWEKKHRPELAKEKKQQQEASLLVAAVVQGLQLRG